MSGGLRPPIASDCHWLDCVVPAISLWVIYQHLRAIDLLGTPAGTGGGLAIHTPRSICWFHRLYSAHMIRNTRLCNSDALIERTSHNYLTLRRHYHHHHNSLWHNNDKIIAIHEYIRRIQHVWPGLQGHYVTLPFVILSDLSCNSTIEGWVSIVIPTAIRQQALYSLQFACKTRLPEKYICKSTLEYVIIYVKCEHSQSQWLVATVDQTI